MKITYDAEVDALYIQFLETTVTTEHLAEGLAADYDAEGRLAGIEILDALKRFGSSQTLPQVLPPLRPAGQQPGIQTHARFDHGVHPLPPLALHVASERDASPSSSVIRSQRSA